MTLVNTDSRSGGASGACAGEIVWRRAGRSRCRLCGACGRGGGPDWPQRRRQDHHIQFINGQIRPDQGEVGWMAAISPACRRSVCSARVARTFQITATFGSR